MILAFFHIFPYFSIFFTWYWYQMLGIQLGPNRASAGAPVVASAAHAGAGAAGGLWLVVLCFIILDALKPILAPQPWKGWRGWKTGGFLKKNCAGNLWRNHGGNTPRLINELKVFMLVQYFKPEFQAEFPLDITPLRGPAKIMKHPETGHVIFLPILATDGTFHQSNMRRQATRWDLIFFSGSWLWVNRFEGKLMRNHGFCHEIQALKLALDLWGTVRWYPLVL